MNIWKIAGQLSTPIAGDTPSVRSMDDSVAADQGIPLNSIKQ